MYRSSILEQSRRELSAKRRAELASPVFFCGEEALQEVAKPDGLWNWALVGPDPSHLTLVAGGMGGVEEMRGVVGVRADCFGLLRMTFGVGDKATTQFVCVHVSDRFDVDGSSPEHELEHGLHLLKKPVIIGAIRGIAAFAAEVHIESHEDCTVENVVEKLRDAVRGVDAELITVENFKAAVSHHEEQNPEVKRFRSAKEDQARYLDTVEAPMNLQPERENATARESSTRLRRKVKLYAKGEMVEVWSTRHSRWIFDGEVVDIACESYIEKDLQIAAGSLKVVYLNGTLFEWLAPQLVETHLRPSPRPTAPPPIVGNLFKETHKFAFRHLRYTKLSKGFLRWWDSEESYQSGADALGFMYLLDLQQGRVGTTIRLRSSSTRGVVRTFQATTEEEAEAWSQALWAHAGYCQDVREFSEATKVQEKRLDEQIVTHAIAKMLLEEDCDSQTESTASFGEERSRSTLGSA